MEFRADARPSPIAGSWYAGDADSLAIQVDDFMRAVKLEQADLTGKVVGLVVPHAGYIYSGCTAAYAYKTVAQFPRELVVILSPLHQYDPHDFLTTAYRAYQTPFGEVEVAQNEMTRLNALLAEDGLCIEQSSDEKEHSLEIQLPFLQRIWQSEFRLIPIMIRTYESAKIKKLSIALSNVLASQDALIIASSDLSHFQPLNIAEQIDAGTLKNISQFDPDQVLAGARDNSAPACGAASIAAMLKTTKRMGADKVQILNYSTSADSTRDKTSVVGYGSATVLVSE